MEVWVGAHAWGGCASAVRCCIKYSAHIYFVVKSAIAGVNWNFLNGVTIIEQAID